MLGDNACGIKFFLNFKSESQYNVNMHIDIFICLIIDSRKFIRSFPVFKKIGAKKNEVRNLTGF